MKIHTEREITDKIKLVMGDFVKTAKYIEDLDTNKYVLLDDHNKKLESVKIKYAELIALLYMYEFALRVKYANKLNKLLDEGIKARENYNNEYEQGYRNALTHIQHIMNEQEKEVKP